MKQNNAEAESYAAESYVRPSKRTKPVATTARKPIPLPSVNAPSEVPFEIEQGIRTSEQWFKLFFYGDYGAGKTVMAASAADVEALQDVLYIDIESGRTSIKGSGAVEHYNDITFIKCRNFESFVRIHRMLIAYCQARDDDDKARLGAMAAKYGFDPKKRFRTVVIDSMSELNQISLQRAFGENPDDLLGTADSDDTRRDFGRNKQAMMKTIRAFRNLPMHVIATCGCEWDQDERKKLGYQPRLTGQLAKEVQAFWDVVGFMQTAPKAAVGEDDTEAGGVARRLWLQRVGKFDAKNRLSSQEVTHLDDPDMNKLIGLLTRKKTASTSAPKTKV